MTKLVQDYFEYKVENQTTTDSLADLLNFQALGFKTGTIQVVNTHATNAARAVVQVSNKTEDSLASDDKSWKEHTAEQDVAAGGSIIVKVSESYRHFRVQVKAKVSGNQATVSGYAQFTPA